MESAFWMETKLKENRSRNYLTKTTAIQGKKIVSKKMKKVIVD